MADPGRHRVRPPQLFWVHLCCWLAKQRGFFWGTVILGIVLNLFVAWLITPWGSTFSNTPLGTILDHRLVIFVIGIGLLALTVIVSIVNRRANAHPTMQGPTLQNRSTLVRALHQEYRRLLADSLQGVATITMGLYERKDIVPFSIQ